MTTRRRLQAAEVKEIGSDLLEMFHAAISDLYLLHRTSVGEDQFSLKIKTIVAPLERSVESFYQDCLVEEKLIEEAKKNKEAFSDVFDELCFLT